MSIFDNGLDDFWDIEKLVPKKKPTASPFVTKSPSREHIIDGETPQNASENRKLTIPVRDASSTDRSSYDYSHSSLIGRVTVIRDIDKYDFYENFRKAALVYYDFKTEKCDFAKYYSYMPQYSQLTMEQKNYYFYWRSELRRGKYLKSDYSYLYLYVYEILNLPDKVLPEKGITILCRLWREYRKALPKIDAYFALWVQDYCLVYDLRLPIELIADFVYDIVFITDFPEFYLSDLECVGVLGTESMLMYLSSYDWRRGKFAAGEHFDLYKEHLLGAMSALFAEIFADGVKASAEHTRTLSRTAFAHSLCTHAVKCRLEVEYTPLSRDEKLRTEVTEAVRYTENKLRALLGIKSRLGIKALPESYKNIIDAYFAPVINAEKQKREARPIPEYEKLYDAPREVLSFADADELELASWTTTARLVSEENEPEIEEITAASAAFAEENTVENTKENTESDTYGLGADEIAAIGDCLSGGNIDDSTAERINEAFADGFGDIILEFDGEGYTVIDDYREEICAWLTKITK